MNFPQCTTGLTINTTLVCLADFEFNENMFQGPAHASSIYRSWYFFFPLLWSVEFAAINGIWPEILDKNPGDQTIRGGGSRSEMQGEFSLTSGV